MSSKSPLELPPVASQLAFNLTTGSLYACIRVSKDWHGLFLPYLWRTILVGIGCADTSLREAWADCRWHGPYPENAHYHRHLENRVAWNGFSSLFYATWFFSLFSASLDPG
ncbi:MAG: hypothetical protein J3Q66DRAFT_386687 [Benniella sp.]|nr:MAG: hypothetical protein J3Q66DRAFT_386687 [Benniella sp.]